MKKVKKNKKNRILIPLITLFIVILAISAALLVYIYTQNYIDVEYIDKSSKKVQTDDVTSVTPIIMNNVVIGGVSDKGKWLDKGNMYGKANITKGAEIDMYNMEGKMGTFEIYSVYQDQQKSLTYAIPLKDLAGKEYIAIAKTDKNAMERKVSKIEPTQEDIKYVKKALGKYKLFNSTVKVNEVYEGYLSSGQKTRIISATSSGKNKFGVYSVVIYVTSDKCDIIKYSYVKNTESSINWPVYSIKFACDLNNDNNYEIILQETRELTMKYSVLEFQKNKYYEVLGLEFKI